LRAWVPVGDGQRGLFVEKKKGLPNISDARTQPSKGEDPGRWPGLREPKKIVPAVPCEGTK